MWPLGTSTGLRRPASGAPAMRHNKAGRSPRPTPATLRQGRRPGSERRAGQRPRGAGDRGGVGVAGSPPGRRTGALPPPAPPRTDGRTDGRTPDSRRGPAPRIAGRPRAHLARDLVQRVVLRRQPLPRGEPLAPRALGAHVHRPPPRGPLPPPAPRPPGRPSLRRGVMASAGAGGDAGTQGDGAGGGGAGTRRGPRARGRREARGSRGLRDAGADRGDPRCLGRRGVRVGGVGGAGGRTPAGHSGAPAPGRDGAGTRAGPGGLAGTGRGADLRLGESEAGGHRWGDSSALGSVTLHGAL